MMMAEKLTFQLKNIDQICKLMDIVLYSLYEAILGLSKYTRLGTLICLYLQDIRIVIFKCKNPKNKEHHCQFSVAMQ